ncbi:DUF4294 domain-containing protein [Carboxylicivirga sp. A043]|uniref:DUF4294 domain-containing protein n=1 Tax=Carboxylicivirga litoralis TaxID=2816963 RepID=UPI0021CAEE9A|nr:DUF4294 domain-containing protein [Carboxylicivirga sp. A043]MCU4157235.1 DUF4294 domain-containing protein [Carboxylicivirga sp. A043]
MQGKTNYISYFKWIGCYWLVTLVFINNTNGQELADSINLVLQHRIIENDTLPHINLQEIPVIPPYKFKNKRHKRRYGKMVRNIKKVLPYARSAGEKVNAINAHLSTLTTEKEKKEYLKQAEKELFDEFEAPLRKLTFSQGRLLIKLINRETGDTTYDLIKQYKGGFTAFFWQGVARLFGSNLKSEYYKDGDDQMIEHIILLIDNGII